MSPSWICSAFGAVSFALTKADVAHGRTVSPLSPMISARFSPAHAWNLPRSSRFPHSQVRGWMRCGETAFRCRRCNDRSRGLRSSPVGYRPLLHPCRGGSCRHRTVLTGSVTGSVIPVVVSPSGLRARVRSLHATITRRMRVMPANAAPSISQAMESPKRRSAAVMSRSIPNSTRPTDRIDATPSPACC